MPFSLSRELAISRYFTHNKSVENREINMQWKGRRTSNNVDDRRSGGGARKGLVGGGIGTVVAIVAFLIFGGDPASLLNMFTGDNGSYSPNADYTPTAEDNELAEFSSVVLADTEDTWTKIFAQNGDTYDFPKLVLFSGSVDSACGSASSSSGPFYCPGDQSVYLDLSFFSELKKEYGAPGDFACAYVIAHEVGHHVQYLYGIIEKVDGQRDQLSEAEYNALSVRLELQADYLAGVYAHYAADLNILEDGDLEEALNAASAIGDDRLQKQAQGYTVPDSFTHGTSAQRRNWFFKGYKAGDLSAWDTFAAKKL
jgi:predicted metalloprotease